LGLVGCGDGEELPDVPPDYYYCLKLSGPKVKNFLGMIDVELRPGEETTVNISEECGILNSSWAKAERRPVSEAVPFVVRVVSAKPGITVTPTGVTSSSGFTVKADQSLAEKPWYLEKGYRATADVRLQNPKPNSRGVGYLVYIHVKSPEEPGPVSRPEVKVSLSPQVMSLGAVKVSSQASSPLTVYNSGAAEATIAEVSISDCQPVPCPFSVGGLAAGTTLPVASSRALTLTFKPTVAKYSSADLIVYPTKGRAAEMYVSGTGQ